MWVLDSCCFCIDLRIGTLILGYLGLMGNMFLAIQSGLAVASGACVMVQDYEKYRSIGTIILTTAVTTLVIFIVNMIFTILLLVGVHKDKRGYVKAFLIYEIILIVLIILLLLVLLIGSIFGGSLNTSEIIENIIISGLIIYYWSVIRSYWVKMGENSEKNPPVYGAKA